MLLLFDVDGTLTVPRNPIVQETKDVLVWAKQYVQLGVVSGSDLPKLKEQIGDDILELFDYVCSENGLVTYYKAECIHTNSMTAYLGEDAYQRLVNICLRTLSDLELPIKRGTFLELRTGMLNICPIGRSCTQKERDEFEQLDNQLYLRQKIVKLVVEKCKFIPELDGKVQLSIGGQISIDCFPVGWNKTYCLDLLKKQVDICFFGDRIFEGGNDFEIGCDPRVKAHKVTGPQDTVKLVKSIVDCIRN